MGSEVGFGPRPHAGRSLNSCEQPAGVADGIGAVVTPIARMVWQSGELQAINASTVKDKYLFYAIAWSSANGPGIGIIRKKNARATISSGSFFGLNNGALKAVDVPDFVVDSSADVIVHGDLLYMLNENSARNLFADS